LPLRIDFQFVELDPAATQDEGRIDIAFSPLVPREDIYFALECKRLNVRGHGGSVRPCHAEYIRHGMARFINGQYGPAVRAGGMLGYVLDGQVAHAMAGVEANVQQHHETLGMAPPGVLLPSSVRAHDDHARETRHRRLGDAAEFAIHHLFVACDPQTPLRVKSDIGSTRPAQRRRARATRGKRVTKI
jgi:hypothetical protein